MADAGFSFQSAFYSGTPVPSHGSAPPPASAEPESETETASKKPRHKQACDNCRIKKSRCDQGDPCRNCKLSGKRCTYTSPKRKRGIPTGYLQSLEKTCDRLLDLLGYYIENVEGGEATMVEFARNITALGSNFGNTSIYKRAVQRSSILDILELNSIDLTVIRSGLKRSESKDYRVLATAPAIQKTGSVNPSHGSNISAVNQGAPVHPAGLSASIQRTEAAEKTSRLASLGQSSGLEILLLSSFQKMALQQETFDVKSWKLYFFPCSPFAILDGFFSYINPILPMVNRERMVQLAMSTESANQTSAACLLWSILFYAYSLTEESTKNRNQRFETKVLHDLQTITLATEHTLETVQALIYQGLYFWAEGYWRDSWILIGNAVRVAIDLEINLDYENKPQETRRTWKVCCLLDTLIAGRLGRLPQVTRSEYSQLEEINDPEKWRQNNGPKTGGNGEINNTELSRGPDWRADSVDWDTLNVFNGFLELNNYTCEVISTINRPHFREKCDEVTMRRILLDFRETLASWVPRYDVQRVVDELMIPGNLNVDLLPHNAQRVFGFISLLVMMYLMERDFNNLLIQHLFTVEEIAQMTVGLLENFTLRYPRVFFPSFEYYLSFTIVLIFREGVSTRKYQNFSEMLAKMPQMKTLMTVLEQWASRWHGAAITYNYFTALAAESENTSEYDLHIEDVYSTFMNYGRDSGDINDVFRADMTPFGS